ncbi:STAS domain-containing protein [candidate division KSB1 bacterium]|nr:STAS domain-containing protein [candidate division KSB1 bacterium]
MARLNEEVKTILKSKQTDILDLWKKHLFTKSKQLIELIGLDNLNQRTTNFLTQFIDALSIGDDISQENYKRTREFLSDLSQEMTQKNLTPSETAMFVFSVKDAIFPLLMAEFDGKKFVKSILLINSVIDQLGLVTIEEYLNSREIIIREQQNALTETSVPVVKVWNKIIMVPLVGMLDSSRTELMLETLLESIEDTQAKVAILDISGIPIVDTLVAGHLIKTATAARLMGTDCIITGIGSKISQTMVQLGIDLSAVVSRTTLEDGLKLAFEITNQKIKLGE